MNKVLKELCLEILAGDICSERFSSLWIQSGLPLEGSEFEVANFILTKASEQNYEENQDKTTWH